MRNAFLIVAIVAAGCTRGTPPAAPVPATVTTPATASAPKGRPIIASDRPDFQAMVKDLETDKAATSKYQGQMLRLEMTVDAVKETKKDSYVVSGKVGQVAVKSTFFTPANLEVNRQVKEIGPGDTVTFTGELASFKPGPPNPEITIDSGAIQSIENKK